MSEVGYEAPAIEDYGDLTALTADKSGSDPDFLSGQADCAPNCGFSLPVR